MKKVLFALLAAAWLNGYASANGCCAPACPPPACQPSCCEEDHCCKPGLLDRLRGMFHRHNCCEDQCAPQCAPPCPPPCKPACQPVCKPVCQPTCQHSCQHSCQPACPPACSNSCGCEEDHCCKPGLLERLRGLFHRNRCCEDECNTCGNACGDACGSSHSTHSAPAAGGETIQSAPKKLPAGGGTSLEIPGQGAGSAITAPAAPSIQTIPAPAIDNRSPF